MHAITCSDLQARMGTGVVIIDVMTPEDYAAGHLPSAHNACIYEMVFLERISACVPSRDSELVVYDATGTTRSAETARERLLQAGYAHVTLLAGGLAAWRAAGLPVEADQEGPQGEPVLQDGSYGVDTGASRLEWIGRNFNNRHQGTIAVQSGALQITNGRPAAADIVLDMQSICNTDLQDPGWRDLLVRHLKSEDFFSVEQFPTASFILTGWGGDNTASGDLTIRDVTRPIVFSAAIQPQQDGSIKAHAFLDINRTLWQVCYGSARLFERLGMHLVHDMISLELFILARPRPSAAPAA